MALLALGVLWFLGYIVGFRGILFFMGARDKHTPEGYHPLPPFTTLSRATMSGRVIITSLNDLKVRVQDMYAIVLSLLHLILPGTAVDDTNMYLTRT